MSNLDDFRMHTRKFTKFFQFFRNIDQIQDIMDDVAEQLQVSNEMSDLISSPIGGGKRLNQ